MYRLKQKPNQWTTQWAKWCTPLRADMSKKIIMIMLFIVNFFISVLPGARDYAFLEVVSPNKEKQTK
jgi:hypothetical protein